GPVVRRQVRDREDRPDEYQREQEKTERASPGGRRSREVTFGRPIVDAFASGLGHSLQTPSGGVYVRMTSPPLPPPPMAGSPLGPPAPAADGRTVTVAHVRAPSEPPGQPVKL